MRRCTRSEARHARGAANAGSNTVTLGRGVIVTALAVSVHCDGMVDGSCTYADQSGVGTAAPMHTSCSSAFDSPGAASAVLYSPVGVRLRKSPTPPRTMMLTGPSDPASIQVHPTRGESCSSVPFRYRPSLMRCVVRPGSQENSSLTSRERLSVVWGNPVLPPKLRLVTLSVEATCTRPAGSVT